jgi:hypothetical protein
MPADKIRVQVSLDYILDFQPLRLSFVNVGVYVSLWVHDGSFAF